MIKTLITLLTSVLILLTILYAENPQIKIPAGGTLELKPGGDHVMVMGLKVHPKEGDRVSIVLLFAPDNQQVNVQLTVLKQAPK